MKKVDLKLIEKTPGSIAESWKDFCITSLKYVGQQQTLDLEQMAERLGPLKKIKDTPHGGTVTLEDAEFKILNTCAQSVGWQIVDEDLFEFLSTLKALSVS